MMSFVIPLLVPLLIGYIIFITFAGHMNPLKTTGERYLVNRVQKARHIALICIPVMFFALLFVQKINS